MKHPLSETIANLEWLQEQDLPEEVWEFYRPSIDRLNILIGTLKSVNILQEYGLWDSLWKRYMEKYDEETENE